MTATKPQPRVIVFSTPTCSFCNMAKKYFREKGIKFNDVDVSKDPAAARDMVRRSGQQGVVMTKSKKKYRRKQRKTFPIVPVAIGLFLIGFAVLALASPKAEVNAGTQNSVVPVDVNYAAPELILQNINGETESLADYRGQVVLINNLATVKISS
jgi:glutaredoxin 3